MSTANAAIGSRGASTPSTNASPTTKTPTPASAERPASRSTDARTIGVSRTPKRRSATTRAAGVQTPPGTYLASIESISAWRATRYGIRIP